MKDKLTFGPTGALFITGIGHKDFQEAMELMTQLVSERQHIMPFEIIVKTWDSDYGDVLPNGYVMAHPIMACWAADRRLDNLLFEFPVPVIDVGEAAL